MAVSASWVQVRLIRVRGTAVATAKDEDPAQVSATIACTCVQPVGPDRDDVALDRHGLSKVVRRPPSIKIVADRQPGDLVVCGTAVTRAEDVGRLFPFGPNQKRVAINRHGITKFVVRRAVGGRQLGYLDIRGAAVARAEDVGCARGGVLVECPYHDGVAVNGHKVAKFVVGSGVASHELRELRVIAQPPPIQRRRRR